MSPARSAINSSADERPKTRPKQAMIRSDQQSSLDELARELHDARGVKGERITANTLIRVAIDGIVPHGDQLQGDNEDQLRTSWLEFLEQATALRALQPQADELAGELRAAVGDESSSVTASSLVRVAFEGLLAHRDRVRGRSGEELAASWLEFLDERAAERRP